MKSYIKISTKGQPEKTSPLGVNQVTFGREEGVDIRVVDGAISRKHCALIPDGGGWQLQDFESKNGTIYGGKRVVEPVAVKSGGVFTIGSTKVEVVYGRTPPAVLRWFNHPAGFAVVGVLVGVALLAGLWAYKNHQAKSRRLFAGGGGSIGVSRPAIPIDVASFVPSSGNNIIRMEVPSLPTDPNVKLKKRTIKIKGRLNLQGSN